jgi:hypothetical protein
MLSRTYLLKNGQRSAKARIPVAMALLTVGLMLLGVSVAWSSFSYPLEHLGREWNDFARGFLVGLAIAMEIGALVIALSAVAAAKRDASESGRAPRP